MQDLDLNINFNDDNRKKVIKYLIGKNKNLFGTILGFKKGWRKKRPDNMDYYSFLLYYSHETGRIERFLYNSGSKVKINPPRILNHFNEDDKYLFVNYNKTNDILISKDELLSYLSEKFFKENNLQEFLDKNPNRILNFKLLNDGKLNNNFFNMFLIELLRDYLIFHRSFKDCSMAKLRYYTLPIFKYSNIPSEYLDGFIPNLNVGCGEVNLEVLHHDCKHTMKEENFIEMRDEIDDYFKRIYPPKFIDYQFYPRRLQTKIEFPYLNINLPKNFNTNYNKILLEKFTYSPLTLDKKDLPNSILDLKTFINSRTVVDEDDLIQKIKIFNKNSYNKILSFYNNNNKNINPLFEFNNELHSIKL